MVQQIIKKEARDDKLDNICQRNKAGWFEDSSAIAWSRKILCLPWHTVVEVQVKPWKRLLESFTAISGILSYIISEKTENYGNF